MRVELVNQSITEAEAGAIVVNLFAGVTVPGGATGAVDRALGGAISRLIARGELRGQANETVVIHTDAVRAGKVVVVGLGPADALNVERIRQAAGSALRAAAGGRTQVVATIVHGAGIGGLDPAACARAVVEGSLLAGYRYQGFKSGSDATGIEVLRVCEYDRSRLGALEAGVERGRVLAEATNFARDLVNAPANHMTPTLLAQAALAMSAETGLECTVLERADMERLGMGCLLGVAQGSCQPPKLVVLRYRGAGDGPLLALAGKGITFDSGGVSLKSAEGMQNMKDDMAGAAAVLGAMGAIARLRPALDVLAVVPATENLPSGSALKPGDVVRAMNGKTVEVISTDAEGRLILADAVAYAAEQGADFIVDVATLTGACGVALGPFYSGVVSSDGQLASWIQQAADQSGERFWRLPADDDYRELYRSEVADLKNTGGRQGGAIVGGMFVGEFAGGVPWAHLDIAPTCLVDKVGPYQPKGATGVAVRTLAELAAVIAGWSR